MFFDSHCHLNLYRGSEIAKIIQDAKLKGVGFLHTIATELDSCDCLIKICRANENVYCSVGIHPNNVTESDLDCTEKIVEIAKDKNVISIGETGLDYYYQKTASSLQIRVFIEHIKAAKKLALPLVIHSRAAEEDTIKILEQNIKDQEIPVILHSFASSRLLFEAALKNRWYVSFSGIVTFKNAKEIKQIATEVPDDRILVETDAPYLAPVPMRGKQNLPEYVIYTTNFLKEIKKQPNLQEIMMKNFLSLFNLKK